jgi:hypothetical protein
MKQYQFKLIFFSIYHDLQHTTRSHMDKHQHNNLIRIDKNLFDKS